MTIHDVICTTICLSCFAVTGLVAAQAPPVPAVPGTPPTIPQAVPVASPVQPAVRATPPAPAGSETAVLTPKFQPQSVTILLINGDSMTGTLGEVDQWPMKTSLGTTSVPVSAVAGVRMAQEGNATTTVVLHNGDSITGALQLDHVTIQTDWGRAEIYGTHVTSILFTPGLKWTSEAGLNGTRWKLVADESRPALDGSVSLTAPLGSTPAAGQATIRTTSASAPPRVVAPIRGARP